MFFTDLKTDMEVTISFLVVALFFAIFVWKKKGSLIFGIFTFSALSNIILYTDSSSLFYDVYNLKWIVKFTLWYWPWINLGLLVLLIVTFIKNKNAKTK